MSPLRRIRESALATRDESLHVFEADTGRSVLEAKAGSLFRDDGAVKIHIMRPCAGQGRGGHVYEASMLQNEAGKFVGWPMYIDHESPEQVKANGGLPPSIFKLGGEVLESWWDPNVPAEGRFERGAVEGWVMPSPWMAQLIERFPRQVQASLNTYATGTKPRRSGNRVLNVVEGFVNEGSVDWVTKAGAGGGIDTSVLESVMESWWSEQSASSDTAEWLRKHRPAVVEALINPPNAPEHGEEDEPVDPKQLLEAINALSSEQRQTVVEAILDSDEAAPVIEAAVKDVLKDVLPVAMEAAGTKIEEAALARVDERLSERESLTSLQEAAKARLTEHSELVDVFREDAWRMIAEAEFKPVAADGDGKGGKSAREVMESVVDAEVERVKKLQEAAGVKSTPRRRTTITGNSGGGDDVERVAEAATDEEEAADAERLLEAAGIDYAAAWGLKTDQPEDKKGGAGE
jgi:hypothetical protein